MVFCFVFADFFSLVSNVFLRRCVSMKSTKQIDIVSCAHQFLFYSVIMSVDCRLQFVFISCVTEYSRMVVFAVGSAQKPKFVNSEFSTILFSLFCRHLHFSMLSLFLFYAI